MANYFFWCGHCRSEWEFDCGQGVLEMGGTLALWYDKRDSGTEMVRGAQRLLGLEETGHVRPEVELHFNLWRDLSTSIETNFLDIGLRIRTPLEPVKQFYLYIPCEVQSEHLIDLSQVLKFGQTLDAVFNSVISLGDLGRPVLQNHRFRSAFHNNL